MISRTFKKVFSINQIYNRNISFFSVHHEPIPTSLPKVQSIIINLYVKNRYGVVERVPAFVGQSLLQAINRTKVHAYQEGLCNGYDTTYRPHYRPHDNDSKGPICGSCRVVLEDNWFGRIHKQTDGYNNQQQYLLNAAAQDLKTNSRLACCIPIESWMQGLTCSVDPDPFQFEQNILI